MQPFENPEEDILVEEEHAKLYQLVVYNDDINTFDWVILTLIEVCKHEAPQAEQCAWLVHYKGSCSVKEGEFRFLKPMKDEICRRGIEAKIEEICDS